MIINSDNLYFQWVVGSTDNKLYLQLRGESTKLLVVGIEKISGKSPQ